MLALAELTRWSPCQPRSSHQRTRPAPVARPTTAPATTNKVRTRLGMETVLYVKRACKHERAVTASHRRPESPRAPVTVDALTMNSKPGRESGQIQNWLWDSLKKDSMEDVDWALQQLCEQLEPDVLPPSVSARLLQPISSSLSRIRPHTAQDSSSGNRSLCGSCGLSHTASSGLAEQCSEVSPLLSCVAIGGTVEMMCRINAGGHSTQLTSNRYRDLT